MDKMEQWMELSAQLKRVKKDEMALRKEICGAILKDLTLPCALKMDWEGKVIEAKNGVSHSLDEALVNQMFAELSDADKGALIFKPSLVLRTYKKLPDNSLLHSAVTVKPSAPTLKVT